MLPLYSTRHLPPPHPSTFYNTNLADNEDNKKRKQLCSAQADETDKSSKVTKGLPHQSSPISPLRDISNKLRSEMKELDVMLMDATKLHCRISIHRHSNQHQANLPGISADGRDNAWERQGPCPISTTPNTLLLSPIEHKPTLLYSGPINAQK